ncbi:MAG: hypothetical protein LBG43_00730 [Treponema sp.]|jgi:hypothetical protein|nr:hypothetical protein [Treponema sp.]
MEQSKRLTERRKRFKIKITSAVGGAGDHALAHRLNIFISRPACFFILASCSSVGAANFFDNPLNNGFVFDNSRLA